MVRKPITTALVVVTVIALVGVPIASAGYLTGDTVTPVGSTTIDHESIQSSLFPSPPQIDSPHAEHADLELVAIRNNLGIYRAAAAGDLQSISPNAAARLIAVDVQTLDDVEEQASSFSSEARSYYNYNERIQQLRTDLRDVGNESFQSRVDQHLIYLANTSTAQTEPLNQSQIFETLATLGGTSVPGPAGNERFDVSIHKANGDTVPFAITTVDGRIEAIEAGPQSNPTVTVHAQHSVVRDLRAGEESPQTIISSALDDGRITFDAKGVIDSAIYGALSTVAG